jgi:nucleoporin NUP42
MKNDLTSQRPIYPLSAYGPGRDAPHQLIEGPVEISPDELRVRYYVCRNAGNEGVAVSIYPGREPALANKQQSNKKRLH